MCIVSKSVRRRIEKQLSVKEMTSPCAERQTSKHQHGDLIKEDKLVEAGFIRMVLQVETGGRCSRTSRTQQRDRSVAGCCHVNKRRWLLSCKQASL